MSKLSDWLRTIALIVAVAVLVWLCTIRLMKLQIVQGEEYLQLSERTYSGSQIVSAARGEIYDRNGNPLIVNEVGYNVVVEKSFLPAGRENEILLKVAEILTANNEGWNDSLPVSKEAPYAFTEGAEREIAALKENLNLNVYATVDNCMDALVEKYGLESYSVTEQRILAGIRYEMLLRDFSVNNRFTLAEDISIESVAKIKERSFDLLGVDIAEEAIRKYVQGDIAPHLLGVVGAISADEYEELKEQGYRLNDIVGKFGIEYGMESTLRGTDGLRTIVQNKDGEVISEEISEPFIPGNSIKLTLDMELQRTLQDALEQHVKALQAQEPGKDGQKCKGGAIVVLDVKTGGVLASVNYPSYNLNDYLDDYNKVLTAEGNPTFNRAFNGQYRPGSTFKTVTAIAALQAGAIDASTTVYCTGVYNYYPTQPFTCTAAHGTVDVVQAIRKSCNTFFYEAGRRTGIAAIYNLAPKFGLGIDLGLEVSNATGRISSPATSELLNKEWYPADVVQASIGQLDTVVSPLQMAVQAMTIANRGTLIQPHLVEGVYDYNLDNLIERNGREELSQIENADDYFDLVIEGMILASKDSYGGAAPNGSNYYADLGFDVAVKTGTPQVSTEVFNGAIIGFAPANDPEIAFAVMLEEGGAARHMASAIVHAYFLGDTEGVS